MDKFKKIFGRTNAVVIGMVHVDPLPGTPRNTLPMDQIVENSLKEVRLYLEAGVDALMIENMHDVPYLNTVVGPEVVASMTIVGQAVRKASKLPVGIQVLAAANKEAIAIAQAADLQFIRAEGYVFAHVADEGTMNSCAGEIMRYRKQIGADNVLVFTDIKKKHSAHAITADVSIAETAKAAEFFLSDGVIVTGAATAVPADLKDLLSVKKAVKIPVLIGKWLYIYYSTMTSP
eukprot:TRINITY_DN2182_c0_g1_i2.p1 TRINITY_DN2182_c0_g1~~TRINITY_DN2182_c0_g1_i2.p1  ORF type:complete len:241 (-),score=37.44 TRINITY_DN2182_c0_g1_i2:64-762(-)